MLSFSSANWTDTHVRFIVVDEFRVFRRRVHSTTHLSNRVAEGMVLVNRNSLKLTTLPLRNTQD